MDYDCRCRHIVRLFIYVLYVTECGCGSCQCNRAGYPIEGTVITRPHITDSYVLQGDHVDATDKVVSGVSVYLASDSTGHQVIEGFESKSDDRGQYYIDTAGIPTATNTEGFYYLVAKKEGYVTLVHSIKLGPLAQHLNNRVVLKKVPEEEP